MEFLLGLLLGLIIGLIIGMALVRGLWAIGERIGSANDDYRGL